MNGKHISFAVQDKDIAKFMRHASAKISRKCTLLTLVAAAVTIAFIDPLSGIVRKLDFWKNSPPLTQTFVAIVFFYFLYLFIYRFLFQYSPVKWSHPQGSLLCPKEIRIDGEGLHQSSKHGASTAFWPGILNIEDTGDMIYFYVDLTSAYFIPKRFFANPEEAAAFVTQARHYWNAAREAASASPPPERAAENTTSPA